MNHLLEKKSSLPLLICRFICPSFKMVAITLIGLCFLASCGGEGSSTSPQINSSSTSSATLSSAQSSYSRPQRAPLFEPTGNKKMFIIGQDMVALGGITDGTNQYSDGFLDDIDLKDFPVGITTYLELTDQKGLTTTYNNEGELKNAELMMHHREFSLTKPVFIVGYFIGNDYTGALNGKYDENLQSLANWIVEKNAPTFLRIGYEFNADWTGHPKNKTDYINVFRYIVSKFEKWGVKNCSFVWQSDGNGSATDLAAYYPGDSYVDWMAYSHFNNNGAGLIEMAKKHRKPVMIAEATPIGFNLASSEDTSGKPAWDIWFKPLFDHIHNEPTIRALAYINDNWPAKAMWAENSFFNTTDSRIQKSPYVKAKIVEELNDGTWLNRIETFPAIGWK